MAVKVAFAAVAVMLLATWHLAAAAPLTAPAFLWAPENYGYDCLASPRLLVIPASRWIPSDRCVVLIISLRLEMIRNLCFSIVVRILCHLLI
jgi:hypothetical protein